MNPPGQLIIDALHTHYTAYIYIKEMSHPGQSSTEDMHTATLLIYIYIYIYIYYIYRREMNPLVNRSQRPSILLHCLHIYIYIEGR